MKTRDFLELCEDEGWQYAMFGFYSAEKLATIEDKKLAQLAVQFNKLSEEINDYIEVLQDDDKYIDNVLNDE